MAPRRGLRPLRQGLGARLRRRIPRSQTGRTARVGALGSKLSLRYAWTRLRARLAPARARQAILDRYHLRSAEEVVGLLGNMKGAVMKLGQMVSFVSNDVPEQWRTMLRQLQTSAPPMSFELARQVIEEDLGAPLRARFRDFEPEPLAAASIGQVHRARLRGGEDVVVKVQYPGVDEAIRADLANLGWIYALVGLMNPGFEPKPLAEELRARIGEELDYVLEARNQQHFADLYAGHPFIRVPAVYPEHSSRRVLTQEFVQGHGFEWLLARPEPFRQRAAEILYRFVFGSIALHVFNGDPHPGNYLFHEDGTVSFLDFGCVKYFDPVLVTEWRRLVAAHLAGDRETFRQQLVRLNFVRPDGKVATDLYYDYFAYFYEPFARDQPFTFTPEYAAKSVGMVFDANHSVYRDLLRETNMPPDFALVNRIQWGLYSILAQLRATANWHRIHAEIHFGTPPATALGEAAAAFRARWKRERGIPADADVWVEPAGLRWAPRARVASAS